MGAVAVAVVGEHALDLDALLGVPAVGAAEEADTVGWAFAPEQFCVGEAGVVVDREVQVLPAGVAAAGEAISVDPLPDRPETAQLLDIDVHELAGPLALVAAHRLGWRLG